MPLEPDQRLLEEYHASLQSYIFEAQLFWTRISAFVLLNSALLVARSALPSGSADRWTKAGIAILGIAAALLWALTAVRARQTQVFWLAMLRDIESRLGMGAEDAAGPYTTRTAFLAGETVRLPRGGRLRLSWFANTNMSDSTSAMLTLIAVFGVVWIVALIKLA